MLTVIFTFLRCYFYTTNIQSNIRGKNWRHNGGRK